MDIDTAPWSETANVLYGALNHSVWGLGLGCFLLLCFLRAPGTWWARVFLSAGCWQPLVKLSYLAYLLHPLVLVFFLCQLDGPLLYLDSTFISNFIAFSFIAFVSAFFFWLAVEKPLANLCAPLMGGI